MKTYIEIEKEINEIPDDEAYDKLHEELCNKIWYDDADIDRLFCEIAQNGRLFGNNVKTEEFVIQRIDLEECFKNFKEGKL